MQIRQALLSGLIGGALRRTRDDGYPGLEVGLSTDAEGNYLSVIPVTISGERYLVTVAPENQGVSALMLEQVLVEVVRLRDEVAQLDDGAGSVESSTARQQWSRYATTETVLTELIEARAGDCAGLAPGRDSIPADHLVTVTARVNDDSDGDILVVTHPPQCQAQEQACDLSQLIWLGLSPGDYRFWRSEADGQWSWEKANAVRGVSGG